MVRNIIVLVRAFRRAIKAQNAGSRPVGQTRTEPKAGKPEYEELVDVLARHIHDHWLRIGAFDHQFSSGQQIAATVLEKLSILKRVGDGRYSTPLVFACEPEDFKKRGADNQHMGCSYETVVLALLAIMDYGMPEDELYECLARLGICKQDSDGHYAWTERHAFYMKELYPNWTSLIA